MPGPQQTYVNSGATYDIDTDSWVPAPSSPLTARAAAPAVWTGSAVLIAGGRTDTTVHSEAATYDPRSRRWETLPSAPNCPSQMIRIENFVFALGGCASGDTSDASYFDLRDESWTALPDSGVGEIVGATVFDGHPVAVGDSGALAMYERKLWRAIPSTPVAPGSGGFKVLQQGQKLVAVTSEATTAGDVAMVSEFRGDNWEEVGRGGAPVQDSFPDGVASQDSILWSTFGGLCTWDGSRAQCVNEPGDLSRTKAPIVITDSDDVTIWGGADLSSGSPLDTGVVVDDWVS